MLRNWGVTEPDHQHAEQLQIEISKIKATIGPTVTLYEIVPAPVFASVKSRTWRMTLPLALQRLVYV